MLCNSQGSQPQTSLRTETKAPITLLQRFDVAAGQGDSNAMNRHLLLHRGFARIFKRLKRSSGAGVTRAAASSTAHARSPTAQAPRCRAVSGGGDSAPVWHLAAPINRHLQLPQARTAPNRRDQSRGKRRPPPAPLPHHGCGGFFLADLFPGEAAWRGPANSGEPGNATRQQIHL